MRRGGVLPRPITGALLVPVRRGDPRGRPREGKSAKRRQWRRKRAGFEEVPRLAGTTVPVSRLARRWAREPLPYAPQGTHRAGRTGSSAPTPLFVGADAYIGPTGFSHIPGRARGPCPTKNTIVGRGPCVPPFHRTPLQKARHCETSANAGRGNPSSLPPGDRKGRPYPPSFHFQLFSFSSFPRKNPPEAAASGGDSYAQFQFFLKTPRRRSAPPGTAPAPRAHTHTGPRCTTGRPGSCGCRY